MKRVVFLLICVFIIQSYNAYAQKSEETRMKYVYGSSSDFDRVVLGMSFGKNPGFVDTTYYIQFHIDIPELERTNMYVPASQHKRIYIPQDISLTFLSKSGRATELKLDKVKSSVACDRTINDFRISFTEDSYTTTMTIPVTREELVAIGAEPFYKIIMPYFINSSSSGLDKIVFTSPSLLNRRNFTQVAVMQMLED